MDEGVAGAVPDSALDSTQCVLEGSEPPLSGGSDAPGNASPGGAREPVGAVTVLRAPPRLRGRFAGYRMPEEWRAKIQTGVLLARLHKIARGKVDEHPARLAVEVAAAKVLLAKSMPDLAAVQVVSDAERRIEIITRIE